MADAARKEKLAAAKKKLKQFQAKSRPSNSPAPSSRNKVPKEKLNGAVNGQDSDASSRASPETGDAPSLSNTAPVSSSNGTAANSHSVTSDQQHGSNQKQQQTHVSPSSPVHSTSVPHNRMSESTERLHQLSRQINGLLTETESYIKGDEVAENKTTEHFEERNRELASLLQKHSQANEALNMQVKQLRENSEKLQTTLDHERSTFGDRLKRELSALKEQLQVHIQTIGILVAEKTELQSSVNQNQKSAEQRLEEIEELSGRLKASRQRVGDLEKSFTQASSSSQKNEKGLKDLTKEVDRLKMDLYKQNKACEEFQQQNSELQGKLQKKNSESAKMENDVIELRGKLEMAELHNQQLQNSSGAGIVPENTQQIEALLNEKAQLESRIEQYAAAWENSNSERERIAQQYQEYIDQLTVQSQHLQAQINSLVDERDQYSQKCQQLESVIQELHTKQETSKVAEETEGSEKAKLLNQSATLRAEVERLTQNYNAQVSDNQQLSKFVTEQEAKVMELEMTVQRLTDDSVDKDSLLDSMQSDKTALSRAIAQNRELKHQLAELQNGFVKMSNENMELMTGFQTEQHTAKELASRLGQQEEELKELREQLSSKDSRLRTLEETTRLPDNAHHHDNSDTENDSNMAYNMRHYNQQIPLVENLQRELSSAQDTVNALTNQNSELRSQLLQIHQSNGSDPADLSGDEIDHLQTSIRQLEGERNQVLDQLREEQHERQSIQEKLQNMQHDLALQAPALLNGDIINKAQFEALQHAMQQLEVKYTNAMRSRAELTDEVEQLEHIILQLQGETETIGEYVQIYQMQRQVLKRKGEEKDEYISRLARDREEMQDKLAQLQALVMQLLADRNMLHAYQKSGASPALMSNHVTQFAANQLSASTPKVDRRDPRFSAKPANGEGDDWPDYSSDDSDQSEVEPIIAGADSSRDTSADSDMLQSERSNRHTPGQSASPLPNMAAENMENTSHYVTMTSPNNIPSDDATAQRIMHLLTELGSSNVIERTSFTERNFIHCRQCTGRLLNV